MGCDKKSIDTFRKNLVMYMEREGLNQADIARRLNVQTSTVSYWVQGKRYPRPDAMQSIAMILNCTMSDLLSENKPGEEQDFNSKFFTTALLLNAKAYEVLLPIMEAMADKKEYQR